MRNRARALALAGALFATGCSDIVDPVLEDGGYVKVAVGDWHTCGLTAGGAIYCWGRSDSGQIDGVSRGAAPRPRQAASGVRFVDVAAGGAHSCGVTTDQQVYCWGDNSQGQLGTASTAEHEGPRPIGGTTRFRAVSAGGAHTCAVAVGGDVYCWGGNGQGQVGASGSLLPLPTRVPGINAVASVSAGSSHSCAIDATAAAWCWGANRLGQLGDGTTRDTNRPVGVSGGARFAAIAAGFAHTCAVTTDRRLLCWGGAEHGELALGGAAAPGLPGSMVPAGGVAEPFDAVGAGHYISCGVRNDVAAWCWGRGDAGQLGNGSTIDAYWPQPVLDGVPYAFGLGFLAVDAGVEHACGVTNAGAVLCWGRGRYGQLGAGPTTYSPIAVRVVAPH